jgi:hypothetical protein
VMAGFHFKFNISNCKDLKDRARPAVRRNYLDGGRINRVGRQ